MEMSNASSIDIDTPYDLWLAEQQAAYFGLRPADSTVTEDRPTVRVNSTDDDRVGLGHDRNLE